MTVAIGAHAGGSSVQDVLRQVVQRKSDARAPGEPLRGDADASGAKIATSSTSEVASTAGAGGVGSLSKEQRAVVDQLKARDREVKAHEQAHARVGGEYAGAPSYEYQVGPDGNRYAVGGSVQIDVAPVGGDPEATIRKMEVVKAAALAPAEPSAADRSVAALADRQRAAAQAELIEIRAAERRGETPEGEKTDKTDVSGALEPVDFGATQEGGSPDDPTPANAAKDGYAEARGAFDAVEPTNLISIAA